MKKTIVGVTVLLQMTLPDAERALLAKNFEAFDDAELTSRAQVSISVSVIENQYQVTWREADRDGVVMSERSDLVYHVEGFIVLGLQLARPDLLFLHSAVLNHKGRGFMLTGASGNGKSTLCWALTHHDCRYLSDELAPLAVGQGEAVTAQAYPHSLNLKRSPPGKYALPAGTPYTGWTHHVPARELAGGCQTSSCDIQAIFMVEYQPAEPRIDRVEFSDAIFRIYPNVLNGLAHPSSGLTAVKSICQKLPIYDLKSSSLEHTCKMVLETLYQ